MDANESLTTTQPGAITYAVTDDPVTLYIESFPSQLSRRTMTQCLAHITDILAGRSPAENQRENERRACDFRWAGLTPAHVQVIKARVAEKVSKATANKMLSALRGVLAKVRMLRQISASAPLVHLRSARRRRRCLGGRGPSRSHYPQHDDEV